MESARKGKIRKLQIQGLPGSIIRKLRRQLRNLDASFAKGLITRKTTALSTTLGVRKRGCLSCRKPIDGERYIYIDDGKRVEVEAISVFRLLLKTYFYLDLKET
ncbi:unnamed protein product [Cuscuta europaea]|uniref:Uncharacterized protein n=1 Tax=Cuscuta europaea TaxID=41803 RepID=A0A9P1ENN4_CUSEU|nr:unnamed protein product [Cuscuta europaea]